MRYAPEGWAAAVRVARGAWALWLAAAAALAVLALARRPGGSTARHARGSLAAGDATAGANVLPFSR
jgi:UPF0716 family protein affecting phage T7 exclusion